MRKLRGEGRPPEPVGFWFAMGHSTIVVRVAALVAAGTPVTTFGAELAALVTGMFASMRAAGGVGLAASQVGVGLHRWPGSSSRSPSYPPLSPLPARLPVSA